MMAVDRLEHVCQLVARTRAAQGLPPSVIDPLALGRVADVVTARTEEAA